MIRPSSSVQCCLRLGYRDAEGIAWSVTDVFYSAEQADWTVQSERDDGSGVPHFTTAAALNIAIERLAKGNFVTTKPRRGGSTE